jgi:hypothetical protein
MLRKESKILHNLAFVLTECISTLYKERLSTVAVTIKVYDFLVIEASGLVAYW